MTIEQKALELWNAERAAIGCHPWTIDAVREDTAFKALCRALEAHELDKSRHAAEMREQAEWFSEACLAVRANYEGLAFPMLSPFILAPVDPLVEVSDGLFERLAHGDDEHRAWLKAELRKAVPEVTDARGLAIVKKEAVNG